MRSYTGGAGGDAGAWPTLVGRLTGGGLELLSRPISPFLELKALLGARKAELAAAFKAQLSAPPSHKVERSALAAVLKQVRAANETPRITLALTQPGVAPIRYTHSEPSLR